MQLCLLFCPGFPSSRRRRGRVGSNATAEASKPLFSNNGPILANQCPLHYSLVKYMWKYNTTWRDPKSFDFKPHILGRYGAGYRSFGPERHKRPLKLILVGSKKVLPSTSMGSGGTSEWSKTSLVSKNIPNNEGTITWWKKGLKDSGQGYPLLSNANLLQVVAASGEVEVSSLAGGGGEQARVRWVSTLESYDPREAFKRYFQYLLFLAMSMAVAVAMQRKQELGELTLVRTDYSCFCSQMSIPLRVTDVSWSWSSAVLWYSCTLLLKARVHQVRPKAIWIFLYSDVTFG